MKYNPEGWICDTEENQYFISTQEGLSEAMAKGAILEGKVKLCSSSHDLIIDLPCAKGIIPREEGAIGIKEGKARDIALISRVNKPVCFKVKKLFLDENNELIAYLSRRAAQEECLSRYISLLSSGDIIDAQITHFEKFGCFVDIGCGIPSLLPIDTLSVSRISHPSDRFQHNQHIRAVVLKNENNRIYLSHKELLGTWEDNASCFHTGETVSGIIRSVENYGVFVELAPNLAGLAELRDDIVCGQSVSVYIKAIIPEKMKIKLIIVDVCGKAAAPAPIKYFTDKDRIASWEYSTSSSAKSIKTEFV